MEMLKTCTVYKFTSKLQASLPCWLHKLVVLLDDLCNLKTIIRDGRYWHISCAQQVVSGA